MADDLPERLDFDSAERREVSAGEADAGARLDVFLADHLEDFSRSAVQRLIQRGAVLLNGAPARPSVRLRAGDRVVVTVPARLPPAADPEDLPLRVIHEEASFLVIDKAPGMAVHPGRGRPSGTVANAIAFRYGGMHAGGDAYRPGIVHRLDLETSGVMVIAKTDAAHARLAEAFKSRVVRKEYRALVFGEPAHDEDAIELPLGRDLAHPTRMAVRFDGGRESVTEVCVLERFAATAAHVLCRPLTGRTHQIRVHLLSAGHPLLGDRIYAGRRKPPVAVPRLMLHARALSFPHPVSGAIVEVETPLPADFEDVLLALRRFGPQD